jgi:hypothetical protein
MVKLNKLRILAQRVYRFHRRGGTDVPKPALMEMVQS